MKSDEMNKSLLHKAGLAAATTLIVLSTTTLVSCNDELDGEKSKTFDKNTIAFVLGHKGTGSTRGEMAATTVAPSSVISLPVEREEEQPLCLVETITSLDGDVYDAVMGTRGTPIYTENFDAIYGGFDATAYVPKNDGTLYNDPWGNAFGDGGTVSFIKDTQQSNTYYYNYSNSAVTGVDWNLGWPETESGQLLFFLQSPATTTKALEPKFYAQDNTLGRPNPLGTIRFSYTSPHGAEGAEKDAEAQKDILFTSKLMAEGTKDTQNHILFYHALTGVKFQNGNAVDENGKATEIVRIKKVVLNNIVGTGDCVIAPNYADGTNTSADNKSNATTPSADASKSAQCSIWSNLGDPDQTFTQAFASEVNEYSKKSGAGSVPESFNYKTNTTNGTPDKTSENTTLHNLNNELFTQTFMLIPQTLANATVTVYYTLNESANNEATVYQRTVRFPQDTEWKAGELHTYTLTINDVRVDIKDDMSDDKKMKSNIVTKNTGNVTAYLRCALAANWVYDDPDTKDVNENVIVSACDIFKTGVFYKDDDGSDKGFKENWVVGSDGYIYYTYPVLPGKPTKKSLFYSYVAPDGTPYKDAHLEFAIALQGVQFDKDKAKVANSWNVGNVKAMTMSFDNENNVILTETNESIFDRLWTEPEKWD